MPDQLAPPHRRSFFLRPVGLITLGGTGAAVLGLAVMLLRAARFQRGATRLVGRLLNKTMDNVPGIITVSVIALVVVWMLIGLIAWLEWRQQRRCDGAL